MRLLTGLVRRQIMPRRREVIVDPYGFVQMDELQLNVLVCRLSAQRDAVSPDRETMVLGQEITKLLAYHHRRRLREAKKTWDGQFMFIPRYLLRFAEFSGLNPGVLEVIRRGGYSYERISYELEEFIRLAINRAYIGGALSFD